MSNIVQSSAIESALISNDLSKLSAEQRLSYYNNVCESMGLNPLTQPFAYITLNGKLTLYAKRDATDQLRKVHKVSINITSRETIGDIYVVTARARDSSGREDESTGAVNTAGLKGDNLANAFLKAETKAKRRVTLSICGLGFLDESEVDSIHQKDLNYPGARLEKQIESVKEKQHETEKRRGLNTPDSNGKPSAESRTEAKPGRQPEVKKADSHAEEETPGDIGASGEDDSLSTIIKNVKQISMTEYGQLLALAAAKKVTKEALDKRVKEKWNISSANELQKWQFVEVMAALREK